MSILQILLSQVVFNYIRYRIRGVRNVIFYGLPEHPQFYTELLSYPFLDEGVEASDVTSKALYCIYDALRLERIVGSHGLENFIKKS